MFSRLALRNVKRQIGNYLIYFMTVSLTVALLFAVNNIIFSEQIANYAEMMSEFKTGLIGVVVFISLIVAFVLGYATSFMLKLRKREFGTYLTLGMTRKNILLIFISETMVICLIALGIGIVLGLFIYQGLMAVMMHLMEMEFTFQTYSVNGLIFTVILVVGMFMLASAASAFYLKKVSIYDLIHGDKIIEKSVGHPKSWFVVTVVSFVGMVGSCIAFNKGVENIILEGASANYALLVVFIFAAAVILFHIGLARSVVYVLLNQKQFCSRGTNTFVLRQLSGTLGANSVMIGLIAFLLTFTVIGSNVSFLQKATVRAALNQEYPYDIIYCDNIYEERIRSQELSLSEAEKIIETYKTIEKKIPYSLYTTGSNDVYAYTKWSGDGYEGLKDSFMSESDFNAICEPLGYEPIALKDEFLIVANLPEVVQNNWNDAKFQWNGTTYRFKEASIDYPRFCMLYFFIVVPDKAIETMTENTRYMAYTLNAGKYDAPELRNKLSYQITETVMGEKKSYKRCDFMFREFGRQEQNSGTAILVVGALFIASVFLFMAMAVLALKTLSGISEDRKRYQILFRLGQGEAEQRKTLFRQTFSFFLMPFVIPLVMSIPVAVICRHIININGMEELSAEIYTIAGAIAFVMALIYILYYTATYLIAQKSIVQKR